MKLKARFYEMVKEDASLQIELLKMPEFKHQNVDSLISMAHVKHNYLAMPKIARVICDYYNSFQKRGGKLSIVGVIDNFYEDKAMEIANNKKKLSKILKAISKITGISIEVIKGNSRQREIVEARHSFMLVANKMNFCSQTQIENFVGKAHGSLYNAQQNAHLQNIRQIVTQSLKHID